MNNGDRYMFRLNPLLMRRSSGDEMEALAWHYGHECHIESVDTDPVLNPLHFVKFDDGFYAYVYESELTPVELDPNNRKEGDA